jgi:hypothetical protein
VQIVIALHANKWEGLAYNYNSVGNTYTMTDLIPGTVNKIFVKSKCDGVFSDKSDKITIYVPAKFGEIENALHIFPNPTHNYFEISYRSSERGEAVIRLSDISGRIIFSEQYALNIGENNFSYDVRSSAKRGIYP